jgi:NADH-ubiquinone oxidoreductase chain 5
MSQLGMMVIAVGLSSYPIALFHLVNHAFYKALLFLGAGSVIHAVADNQDFRRYGGLRAFLPLTYSVMLIASLSLVAFPFMTGFYSKDFILESAYGEYYFSGTVVYIIATIGAMFTTLYSDKVLYLTFLTNPNGPLINYKQAHEGDIFMSLPLIILAVFSIFFGFITKDMFIGLGSGFFSDNALFIHPSHEIMLDTEFGVPTLFKLLPLFFTISLSIIAIVLSEYLSTILIYFKLSRVGYNIFSFFNQRFLIELFYNKYITGTVLKLGGQTTKVIDKGSVEYLGPFGLEEVLLKISKFIANLGNGVVTSYALLILVGLMLYLFNLHVDHAIVILVFILSLFLHGNTSQLVTSRFSSLEKELLSVSCVLQSSMNPNSQDPNQNGEGSNQNGPNSEDEDSEDSDPGYSSDEDAYVGAEAVRRNLKDALKSNRVSEEQEDLLEVYKIGERLQNGDYVSEEERQKFEDAGSPDLDSLSSEIRDKDRLLEEIENKQAQRREVGYELSERDSSSDSENDGSDGNDSGDELYLPFLSTGPTITIISVLYRFYKINYFKML